MSPASLPRRIQPIVYAGTEFLDMVLGRNRKSIPTFGLRIAITNADEQERIRGDQKELAMRVLQGVSQSLCIGFAGVDLRRALSAQRKAPRSEYCSGLRSNHDIR
jgi:hypothetical protein